MMEPDRKGLENRDRARVTVIQKETMSTEAYIIINMVTTMERVAVANSIVIILV